MIRAAVIAARLLEVRSPDSRATIVPARRSGAHRCVAHAQRCRGNRAVPSAARDTPRGVPAHHAAERLLDPVDDRADLALVGGGDDQENVCDGQLLGDIVGDQIGAKLVDSRVRSGAGRFRCACLVAVQFSRLSAVFRVVARATRKPKGSPFELMDHPQLVRCRERSA